MGKVVTGQSADEILQFITDFFQMKDDVHKTLERVAKRLDEEHIPHVVVGGMALGLHGYVRVTEDVDLLVTREGLDRIHERLVGRGYVPAFPGARKRLRDTTTGVKVDFLTTGEYPGDGKPKSIAFPDPQEVAVNREGYAVISLAKFVELKLASAATATMRNFKDLADVQVVIVDLKAPRELGEQIDPSVRDEYYRMWDAMHDVVDPFNV